MSDELNPYAAPASDSSIGTTRSKSPRHPNPIGPLVYFVGWSWPLVLGLCGVAADRVRIPALTKVVLSFASLLLPVFVTWYGGRWRWGCATVLGAYCLLSVLVMWFWN
ncbi:hypothetical protein SAMN05444166_7534 [Singulisphaera sp. GP187]|nr:hypothetical protein SAMN05444166_7534 [Singulisphaera sp. GP187]